MTSKVNANTVIQMREQYKYTKERLTGKPRSLEVLEYETVLWERHLNVSLRGEDFKKGVLPKVVDMIVYKAVKEAFLIRMAQENK